MYTSYIGRKFIAYYNRQKAKSYTAETFFLDKFFPCFFTDEGHLMHVANSPFHYAPAKAAVATYKSKSAAQLETLKESINENKVYMGNYVGGPALGTDATTSGQLTSIGGIINREDVYASWIGAALGIGVSGGYVMLIDNEELLLFLYKGWKKYKKYLEQTPGLKDKQIETWNGNWVSQRLENPDCDDYDWIRAEKIMGKLAIRTESWAEVTFALARKFHRLESIIVYGYNLSQTNTTLGFVSLMVSEVKRLFEWRRKIFLQDDPGGLKENHITTLATYYDFKAASKMGTVGLKALEPKELREYMPKPFGRGKDFVYSKDAAQHFQIFKIWLMAMLNKIELLNLADKVAIALKEFAKSDKKGRSIRDQLSKEIRESKTRKQFIDNLKAMLDEVPTEADDFYNIVEETLIMPVDHFPLFLTLIRFQYSYRTAKS
ncbi:hypothetical protein [Chitinophaga qingshengii]|uniref:Uncharacterized protein n=1 Tax=Chitinophaga qingshengii TaxID=1569794 RepID=A0ABR7TF15_9BACT|nr:hypothetical protein [Chitinophaga qingshengii]MBC9928895.1 hypothetical protein [Chitinophaga qingshengii]